ncbi:CsbD family protein [Mycobacterium sp.]|jgi:uncharacterized protein YjbJ (UPF0337 family)|uniref:CsbD family protein n=1 Tax=Mycobacterium sp. TaxID=1785 RepID=UPI002D6C64D6|nr:CsbD family protein [Mycobacterium sp.]HZA09812.1 CsbD family protein [Mycobacterium sp.]
MSAADRARSKADKIKGKAKEQLGRATGDRGLEDEGTVDRVKGSLKETKEELKGAFRRRRR